MLSLDDETGGVPMVDGPINHGDQLVETADVRYVVVASAFHEPMGVKRSSAVRKKFAQDIIQAMPEFGQI